MLYLEHDELLYYLLIYSLVPCGSYRLEIEEHGGNRYLYTSLS